MKIQKMKLEAAQKGETITTIGQVSSFYLQMAREIDEDTELTTEQRSHKKEKLKKDIIDMLAILWAPIKEAAAKV